jgi:outer membrane protein TolC
VKGQQLFHSFLPGVTAAVLTTQPAWAGTVKVNGLQLVSSPSVSTATSGQTSVANLTTEQLQISASDRSPVPVSYPEWISLNLKPVTQEKFPLIKTGKTSLNKGQILRKNESRLLSLASTSYPLVPINQRQINSAASGQKSENIVVPAFPPKLPSVPPTVFSLSASQQPITQQKKYQTQLPTVSPTAVTNGGAKLLAMPSCSTKILGCLQSAGMGNLVAQNNPPTPENVNPAPVEIPPTPENVNPAPVEIPENLNPNSNPLQFPTKPEEVTVQANQPISLEQALELARRNNRELQVALLELERNKAALREAQAGLLPSVGISTSVTRQRSTSDTLSTKLRQQAEEDQGVPPEFRTPSADANTAFTGQLQLQYDIYTSGAGKARRRAAEEQVRVSELAVERQSEEIRLNVSTEYYDLQQADEQVRIAQSAVQNAQASLKDAEALERAGVGTRFDVLRSQVNLANATQELTNSVSQQQIARRRLAVRLSLPQSVTISASDEVKLAGLWNQTLEQSIVLAFQNRPELQQQLAQRNISEQQRRQALSALGPQISLLATYDLLDQFDDGVSVSDGYSVGVRATLNLYDGGAARARAAQAKANIAIAETQFADLRDQIRFQVEQAFTTQRSNLDNVQTANTALDQAREALRLARLRFQAGVGTQTDVINSENDLTRAEGNRIRAILDYNRALANLQRSVTSRAFR